MVPVLYLRDVVGIAVLRGSTGESRAGIDEGCGIPGGNAGVGSDRGVLGGMCKFLNVRYSRVFLGVLEC